MQPATLTGLLGGEEYGGHAPVTTARSSSWRAASSSARTQTPRPGPAGVEPVRGIERQVRASWGREPSARPTGGRSSRLRLSASASNCSSRTRPTRALNPPCVTTPTPKSGSTPRSPSRGGVLPARTTQLDVTAERRLSHPERRPSSARAGAGGARPARATPSSRRRASPREKMTRAGVRGARPARGASCGRRRPHVRPARGPSPTS